MELDALLEELLEDELLEFDELDEELVLELEELLLLEPLSPPPPLHAARRINVDATRANGMYRICMPDSGG